MPEYTMKCEGCGQTWEANSIQEFKDCWDDILSHMEEPHDTPASIKVEMAGQRAKAATEANV